MAYLENFDPPELPVEASTLRHQLQLGLVFHARQIPPSSNTARLLTTYMITTDKAAREYAAGCQRVREYMTEVGGIEAFIEGIGHFENCINSAKRALRALERLGAQQDGPEIDRIIRNLAQSQTKTITNLRDSIEHIDAHIVSAPGIPEGEPHLLIIDKKGEILEIGSHKIAVSALQGVIRALHSAGQAIIHALPTPADA